MPQGAKVQRFRQAASTSIIIDHLFLCFRVLTSNYSGLLGIIPDRGELITGPESVFGPSLKLWIGQQ